MKRFPTIFPTTNPFFAWLDLASNMSGMLFASALVIQHRSGRIAAAGPTPSLRDRREFVRMGQEKLEAAAQSAQAMALQMTRMNMEIGARMMRQMMANAPGMATTLLTPSLFWSPHGQQRLLRMFSDYATLTSHLSSATARLAGHGLKPVHSRAAANARRLVYLPSLRKSTQS